MKRDMQLVIPPEVFEIKKWACTVRSNRGLARFLTHFTAPDHLADLNDPLVLSK